MADVSLHDSGFRRAVRFVALANLAYFGIEFVVALVIGSVSLFADSIDFLEDASVNLLILAALGWTARSRARVGMGLAGILLVPGLATLWVAWQKVLVPVPPAPLPLSLTASGALAVNLTCAFVLTRSQASCWEPVQGCVSFGAQRRPCQRRDHRRGARNRLRAVGMA